MCKFIRIEIDGNKTYLRYDRGLIQAIVPIKATQQIYTYRRGGGLVEARGELRREIQAQREELRERDNLAAKGSGAILRLFNRKREREYDKAFQSKGPVNLSRHVGVEIEFISSDSRRDIAKTLARMGVAQFVELKSDGSVRGEGSGGDNCDGSCRENCECSECGEHHYCDDETECARRNRDYGNVNGGGRNSVSWEIREDCRDCRSEGNFETLDDCDCGGTDADGDPVCAGEHVNCVGHCVGHYCNGSEDHPDYDCNCECTCGGADDGHEIAIVAKSTQIADVVTRVCAALAEHGATVNNTCGLHVHVDMRGRKDVKQAFGNLVKAQRLLYSMVPKSRYTNSYCRPNESLNMRDYHGRYWGINPASYSAHKTLEVRLHSGTVSAEKINHWIKLLQKIAYSKRVRQVDKLSDLTRAVNLGPALLEYVKARIEKFADDHGAYSLPIGTDAPTAAPALEDAAIASDEPASDLVESTQYQEATLPF